MNAKQIKVGDTVLVRAKVVKTPLIGTVWLETADSDPDEFLADLDAIVSVEPRPLQVGDRVEPHCGGFPGNIVAIDGDEAWVRWGDDSRGTWRLTKLRRVAA